MAHSERNIRLKIQETPMQEKIPVRPIVNINQAPSSQPRLKVLLVAFDLYRTVGGGQTVYRKIIESAKDTDFYYFREREEAHTRRPENTRAIPAALSRPLKVLEPPPFPKYRNDCLIEADRIARSVAGRSFDIVDMPDFFTFGNYLRAAFDHYGVKVKRIVLAMHGNISVSLGMCWGSAGDNVLEQKILEREQFEAADGIYAISPSYMQEWQAIADRQIHLIDPLNFIDTNTALETTAPDEVAAVKPSLYCIGRMERRKGNDLFVELVRWLSPKHYSRAVHVGDHDFSMNNVSSQFLLQEIAQKRGLELEFMPAQNRQQLAKIFAARSVVILPVRYDSLNLVALEAIFSGCPVAVSNRAGICDYFDKMFPGLPYIKIDYGNFYSAVHQIEGVLCNYDSYRQHLREYLQRLRTSPAPQLDILEFYHAVLNKQTEALPQKQLKADYEDYPIQNYVRGLLPKGMMRNLRRFFDLSLAKIMQWIRTLRRFKEIKLINAVREARTAQSRLQRITEEREYSVKRLHEKLQEIYGSATGYLCRCNFWRDIARIERCLNHDMMAAVYELRLLRLLGSDVFGLLPPLIDTLRKNGLLHEAEAAQALYGSSDAAEKNVYAYLQAAAQRNRVKEAQPFAHLDDRRRGAPKVSVIVSLYNAEKKLKFFLTALTQQTLFRNGEMEIVLIDSGSPAKEQRVFEDFCEDQALNAVYARSSRRETIQAAWNRGILLAEAPYLVFLGVDETLYPESLDVLAAELDENPGIDWVMANSLVTAVDKYGVHTNDIMSYDRTGATRDHTYLETCYLSWVGGMYRKSVHERFGYYDETFHAAGDTEFKNRILPFIQVKFLPRMLGLFLNYPEERTTASPRAEIEDLRAWYIHRTPAGIRYAFENRPAEDVERLLRMALGYRKSYCGHISSDIEYAKYLADYLTGRAPGHPWVERLAADLEKLLKALRVLEFTSSPLGVRDYIKRLLDGWSIAKKYERAHKALLPDATPSYTLFNDNRYEQHSWLWKSTPSN